MKNIIALSCMLALAGCSKQSESVEFLGENGDFEVEKLFTNGNCTLYRFYDGGRRYYSDCTGTVEWKCGKKNCSVTGSNPSAINNEQ